jgi:hypothetical protein
MTHREELPRFAPAAWFHVPHRVTMGLSALGPGDSWLELDGRRASDLEAKRRILEGHRSQTSLALSGSEPAQTEAFDVVWAWLENRAPGVSSERGQSVGGGPLESAALRVQEDLCLMERRGGDWILTAACVCFPTRWDLPSKMGRTLSAIHEAVPGYRAHLARPADRFFDHMKPGLVFQRRNWSLMDDPRLFQPVARRGGAADPGLTPANVGKRVWLRVERQTLRRLPRTGAVLFTIRIHQERLAVLADDPEAAGALAASIRSMDEAFETYKGLAQVRDATLAFADAIATRGAP